MNDAASRRNAIAAVLLAALGFFSGCWAVFVTIASEQFGTNIRAAATTTVPNFVRGSLVGALCFALALLSLMGLRETFGKDLDYLEPHM